MDEITKLNFYYRDDAELEKVETAYLKGAENVLNTIVDRYCDGVRKLEEQYAKDPNNVPKPTFNSSVALLVTIIEDMKGGNL